MGKRLLNDYFLTVLAVFRTQPTFYGGAYLQKQRLLVVNFRKKAPSKMLYCVPKTRCSVVFKEKRNKWSCTILHNLYHFTNSSVFIDMKQTLHYKVTIE